VTVEELAFIGMGAKVLQCLTIGARCTIGAGSVVRSDVPPDSTAVGVPARIVKRVT
jgi:serine O-acetyltransferase